MHLLDISALSVKADSPNKLLTVLELGINICILFHTLHYHGVLRSLGDWL